MQGSIPTPLDSLLPPLPPSTLLKISHFSSFPSLDSKISHSICLLFFPWHPYSESLMILLTMVTSLLPSSYFLMLSTLLNTPFYFNNSAIFSVFLMDLLSPPSVTPYFQPSTPLNIPKGSSKSPRDLTWCVGTHATSKLFGDRLHLNR